MERLEKDFWEGRLSSYKCEVFLMAQPKQTPQTPQGQQGQQTPQGQQAQNPQAQQAQAAKQAQQGQAAQAVQTHQQADQQQLQQLQQQVQQLQPLSQQLAEAQRAGFDLGTLVKIAGIASKYGPLLQGLTDLFNEVRGAVGQGGAPESQGQQK
jgi:ribosomal protein S25